MNILFFCEYFPEHAGSDISGGVEARCYNLSRFLAKNNNVTIITSWRNGLKREEIFSGINILRVGKDHRYSNEAGFFSRGMFAMAAIKEGLKHGDADIIEGYNFTTYFPAGSVAKKLKKPAIITYHETWIGEWVKNKGLLTGIPYEIYERAMLRLGYDKIISVSEFTKKKLFEKGADKKNISVIPNGINREEFSFDCKKEKLPVICFIGRLVQTKKADVLINAISILKKDFPGIKCKIIGQGKEKQKLERLANSLGLKDNVEFLGFVKDSKEVKKILKSSTIFCLPSVAEGFGIVILEAMASGTPYVCSDIEVLREITENGKGGLIFRKNDSNDLAKKMATLLSDRKNYGNKVKEGKELVKKYLWKNLSLVVENLYKEAIDEYKIKNSR